MFNKKKRKKRTRRRNEDKIHFIFSWGYGGSIFLASLLLINNTFKLGKHYSMTEVFGFSLGLGIMIMGISIIFIELIWEYH